MSSLRIIKVESEVDELIKHCKKTGYASIDYETTGFHYYREDEYPLILGVSFQPGSSWIIPLGHKDSPFKDCWLRIFRKFGKEVLENPDIIKVAWNFKFEYKWTYTYGITFKGRLFDAMLAKYCLDEERPHDLKSFVREFFPKYAGYEKAMKDEDGKGANWRNTDYNTLCQYCGIDSDLTLRSMVHMEPKLIQHGFYSLFRNMLMMIMRVLAEAEYQGIYVDRKYLEELMKVYAVKIADADKGLREDRALVKYESHFKKRLIRRLIKEVKLEIKQITRENAPNADRLIANRRNKIKAILEGKLNKKPQERLDKGLNFNSPDQIVDFFFKSKWGLRLKPYKYTKDKKTKQETKTPSTDEDSLIHLGKKDKSGFMKKLLDYRGLVKLDSTYISGLHPLLDHHDRVHAGFKIHGTVTGRLSCTEPNLQNIPRSSTSADIKKMYIPPSGYLLVEVDYGQAELRVIAELANDEAMIDIFRKNYNIHVATACKMNGGIEQYDKVKGILKIADAMDAKELEKKENKLYLKWTKRKKKGKSLNFSIVYQQGDKAMSETLECTKEEAAEFRDEWMRQFPGVAKWIKKQKKLAHKQGYVTNMFGGKRRLYNIDSPNYGVMLEAERQAVNAPIQGASGYFTLLSMIVVRDKILRGEFPRDMRIVYNVHDSIGFYIKPKDIHRVVPEICKICENPETMKYFGFEMKKVKMKVSPEVGKNWADLKEYDPWEDYTKWVTKMDKKESIKLQN